MGWLFKEEPTHYGYDRLEADGRTSWSGVRNPLAQQHLRSVREGDLILYYHTGREKAVVATACAVSAPYPDPADRSGRRVAVDIAPAGRLPRPVTLAEIRLLEEFAESPLLRISRLSVLPVTDRQARAIERLARARS